MDLNGIDRCLDCMQDKASARICPHCGRDEEETRALPYLPYGTRLNDQYVLGKVLGRGGFGITYLAWDTRLDTRVALKEYLPQDFGARGADGLSVFCLDDKTEMFAYGRGKFLQEAQKLARFSTKHSGIVSVLNYFEIQGTAYMVMEFVEGTNLKQHLAQAGGRLPIDKALDIMTPVLDALRDVHAAGLLHRDISPDNIYITSDEHTLILDFGAAKDLTRIYSQSQLLIHRPGYSPEEQYRAKGEQGPWTDVYAAAATLYRMLTGETPPEALDRLADDSLQPPSQLGVAMNQQQETALMKALSVRAPERYQSIADFQNALVVPDEEPENDRKKDPDNSSNAGKFGLFLLLAVVLGALGWVVVDHIQSKNEQETARLRYEKELAQIKADREKAKREKAEAEIEASRLKLEQELQAFREHKRQEPSREKEQKPQEQGRQAQLKEAAKQVHRTVRSYYDALDKGWIEVAVSAWHDLKKPDALRRAIKEINDARVVFIEPMVRFFNNLDTAIVDVTVRVRNRGEGWETWQGPIKLKRWGNGWRILTTKDLTEVKSTTVPTSSAPAPAPSARCPKGYLNGSQIRALLIGQTAYGVRVGSSSSTGWKEYQGRNGTAYFQKDGKGYIIGKWKISGDTACWCYGACREYKCKRVWVNNDCTEVYYEELDTGKRTGRVYRLVKGDQTR